MSKTSNQRSRARFGLGFFLTCAAIVVVATGIVALSMVAVPDEPLVATAALGNLTPSVPGFPAPGGGLANPKPWQYDPASNRHWDPSPGHQHWHPGLPPANSGAPSPSTTTRPPGTTVLPVPGGTTPGGPPPIPWEYDAANDRYWHAGHNHYHPGQPPPPDQR